VFVLSNTDGTGSRIVKEIDLISRGLAWEENVKEKFAFKDTIKEIKLLL